MHERVCLLVRRVYILVGMLPGEEEFALAEQVRRAVVSVRLNFREGFGKRTSREFVSYLNNVMGSLKEVWGCIEVGMDLRYFGDDAKKDIGKLEGLKGCWRDILSMLRSGA